MTSGSRNLRTISVLVVTLALLATACGGGTGGTTTTQPEETTVPATTTPETTSPPTTSPPTTEAPGADFLWVMVTDQAGLGDQGFNDLAFEGVSRAADELGGEAQAIESSEQAQYVPNLQQAVDSGATLIVGVGFLIADAVAEVAQSNPDANFVLIDAVAADADGNPVPNVQNVLFKEQEGAYLAGVISALTTTTNKLGFVGGIEIPPVVRFLVGFQAALMAVNPDANVEVAYVGGFADPAKTKEITTTFFDSGADIVFEVAGAGGLGSYEAVKEEGPGFWVLGTDTCKNQLAPDNYLTSATKDVSGAVFRGASQIVDGTFVGGISTLGLVEDSVGVCDATFGDLPQTIQDAVNDARDKIKSGEIVVPATPEELASFTP